MAVITQEERDEIVRAAFHEAWGRAHDLPDYDKAAWSYVQLHLDPSYTTPKSAVVLPFKR
jgi:hypothetical protein